MHPNGLLFMTTSDQTSDRMELYLENGVIYLGVDVGSGKKVGGRCPLNQREKEIGGVSDLVHWCFGPSQPLRDYIRAEGDFHREIYG